jgi:hypothetical protein
MRGYMSVVNKTTWIEKDEQMGVWADRRHGGCSFSLEPACGPELIRVVTPDRHQTIHSKSYTVSGDAGVYIQHDKPVVRRDGND